MALHELPGYEVVRRLARDADAAREAADGGGAPRSSARPTLASSVTFDGVAFAYDEQPVLRDVSCTIAAGRITAFSGASGAGKTTIVDLLLGLLSPTAGTIRVDRRVLDRTWLDEWRAAVAYVPQDPLLFHDTILANLRWANPAASVADVWAALTSAAAADFVRQLPMGLDTVVGDRGVRLSGGERQRLALARALLRRPALLVLDEATSAIDPESEEHILHALVALRGSVTIALVSHRAAPLALADTVYRLEGGLVQPQPSDAV
jgi:ATP-binding cassette subfamily C protein